MNPEEDNSQEKALKELGFPTGLIRALDKNADAFPLRIWIIDNSGSMSSDDGHRIVATKRRNRVVVESCTRWEEIQDAVGYHANMAATLKVPTVFRLLNDPGAEFGPNNFGVGVDGVHKISEDLALVRRTMMSCRPVGATPISKHLREVRETILTMEESLRVMDKRAVIVLATDGLPTDDVGLGERYDLIEFTHALKSLEGLPVWVVFRLCTGEEKVVNFYNRIDAKFDRSIEVLDDFLTEAKEVYEKNHWLNYALPLHRCREMGFHAKLMDIIDERPLRIAEIREFCSLLFGQAELQNAPDPVSDFEGFATALTRVMGKEEPQWNPIRKKVMPWIDIKALRKQYGRNGNSIQEL